MIRYFTFAYMVKLNEDDMIKLFPWRSTYPYKWKCLTSIHDGLLSSTEIISQSNDPEQNQITNLPRGSADSLSELCNRNATHPLLVPTNYTSIKYKRFRKHAFGFKWVEVCCVCIERIEMGTAVLNGCWNKIKCNKVFNDCGRV